MSGPERNTIRAHEKRVEVAWQRYFASVPGTREAIENLKRASSMPPIPEGTFHEGYYVPSSGVRKRQ